MFSRVFVRTVLVAIVAAMIWALSWTWTAVGFQYMSPRVSLSIIEGSVLLAALSLLIESFLSFASLEIKRGNWRYFLFGFFLIDFDEDTGTRLPNVNARTCAMFGARSFVLSIISLVMALIITVGFLAVEWAVSFLSNPYMPSIDWLVAGKYAGLFAGGFVVAVFVVKLIIQSIEWLIKKSRNTATIIQVLMWVLILSVLCGLLLSIIHIFSPIDNSPLYEVFLMSIGACLIIAAFIGTILALGYGMYKLVGNLSQKFPILQSAWNQICPVRSVTFLDSH